MKRRCDQCGVAPRCIVLVPIADALKGPLEVCSACFCASPLLLTWYRVDAIYQLSDDEA
jgi:hypothetical protein